MIIKETWVQINVKDSSKLAQPRNKYSPSLDDYINLIVVVSAGKAFFEKLDGYDIILSESYEGFTEVNATYRQLAKFYNSYIVPDEAQDDGYQFCAFLENLPYFMDYKYKMDVALEPELEG